ncbi:MAG: CHAD domain-containing protein [Halioglobus sp.]
MTRGYNGIAPLHSGHILTTMMLEGRTVNLDLHQGTARLRALRDALSAQYKEEDLHRLRVTIRRMRSVLRSKRGDKARKLRRRLSELAHTTNSARDWDTLYTSSSTYLGPDQFSDLQLSLHARREHARAHVYRMFHSKKWQTTLGRCDTLAGKIDLEDADLRLTPGKLKSRLKRAIAAARKAVERDNDKHWHKLRIAIKELRYALDSCADEAQAHSNSAILRECKTLQALLGDWHDTVVHRQLLNTLAGDGPLNPATPAGSAADELQRVLADQGQRSLARVRKRLRKGVLEAATVNVKGHD